VITSYWQRIVDRKGETRTFLIQLLMYSNQKIWIYEYLQATNEIIPVNLPTNMENYQLRSGWVSDLEILLVSA